MSKWGGWRGDLCEKRSGATQPTPTDSKRSSGKMCSNCWFLWKNMFKKGQDATGRGGGKKIVRKSRENTKHHMSRRRRRRCSRCQSRYPLQPMKDPYCSKGKIWEGGNRESNCCVLTKIAQPCDACSNGEEAGENLGLRKGEEKAVFKCLYFCFPLVELAAMFWHLFGAFFFF